MAGQKLYIVTSPEDISAVYKNPQTLTFDGFVKDMYAAFGMSSTGIAKTFAPAGTASNNDNVTDHSSKKHVHLGTGIQKEQLHPGKNLADLISVYLIHIKHQMNWENISKDAIVQTFPEKKVVSLRNWCADVLGRATVEAFFGECLLQHEPSLLDDFHNFDTNSWMLMYRYHRMFAK